MKSLLLIIVLLVGCSESSRTLPKTAPALPDPGDIEHSLEAFNGTLVGTNNGEWGGELLFVTKAGDIDVLVKDNVHGIIKNDAGIFAFTGLTHLTGNRGHIFRVSQEDFGDIHATDLGELPGAPSNVHQLPDGNTTFLMFMGDWTDQNKEIYECFELVGKNVINSLRCKPPR